MPGKNQLSSSIFHIEIIIRESLNLRLPLLIECGEVCLLSNHIAGFFDQQNLWNKIIGILVFYA